ncbi:MAG: hypothetical protein DWQ47_16945 [Acidobacteria bacterium]|nr:MAG: hypothetical protein DWQ32_04345 [Acidobacteriota bacterium]REK02269.1 MAG: hypothetical protein DWQ38_07805 [Acidobacteriota bacterium]REK13928.1 MAG: hypothetical protein DWQ43_10035 [Acidobacteriota bacterium]REK41922.1 MAG: hypothetical protein DWQ47_16945 [Acidobacteriota bacterium]
MDGSRTDPADAASEIYKFGKYYLNPAERRLAHDGNFIDIKPRTFEVLVYLVSNSGLTVTKDEILNVVWEGSFVEESNLAVHISRIRKIFETTGAEGYIQTLSGSGYQFVEPIETVESEEWKKAVSGATPLVDPYGLDENRESIAVMPLFNENGDKDIDYLADGMTEALINNLSCRPDLRVIARNTVFKFKDEHIDVVEVGKRLNVSNVLTGRIRIANDDISLSVELSKAEDGSQLWGEKFERDFSEIFEMQDSITNSICEKLNAEIDRAARRFPSQKHTKNTESYRLYLKGRYFVNNRRSKLDLDKAENLFQTSIALDPAFAPGYVELANCLRVQFLYQKILKQDAEERILQLLENASQIDANFADLFVVKGYFEMFLRFNFDKAEILFQKAIAINPGSATAYNQLARLHIYRGATKDGLNMASESARLDPVSYSNDKSLAKIFLMTNQFQNAILRLEECLELAPNDFEAMVLMGFALTEKGNHKEALEFYENALAIQYHHETIAMRSYTYGRMGRKKKALEGIRNLEAAALEEFVPSSFIAVAYSGLGRTEKVIQYLELAYEEKYIDLAALRVDPRWKSVRNHQKFKDLLSKIGI